MKGLICSIYRDKWETDTSANGASNKQKNVFLIGTDVKGPFDHNNFPELPLVIIENHYKNYYRAVEVDRKTFVPIKINGCHSPMFGGTFIWTSDSRFPKPFPISFHDRFEVAYRGGK